jgi:protein-disulfide isomerase
MSKQFAGVLAAIVLIFVGILLITGHKDKAKTTNKAASSSLSNHVQGSTASGVTLTEYGDFQCPYCEQYEPTFEAIVAQFKDQIQIQFRNFPLVNVHQNAFAAARATEAASLQNKFWEMHDALYNPSNWQVWTTATDPTTYFRQYASELGLNATKFKADYASSQVNDLVNADIAEGTRLGVQGTPTFFIDGKKVTITNDKAAFEKIIKAEIAKKAPKTTTTTTAPPRTDTTAPADPTTSGN